MSKPTRLKALLMLLATLCLAQPAVADTGPVIVTNLPVHSLVTGVMEGTGAPLLLVPPGTSPHYYRLRPSERRRLAQSALVIWLGPEAERFLARVMDTLPEQTALVSLLEIEGIRVLPRRRTGVHDPALEKPGTGTGATPDPHVWLEPENAKAIVRAAERALAQLNPVYRQRYRENTAALLARIDQMEARLERQLAPVRDVPYVVFHDALRYLETHYDLHNAGSVAAHSGHTPGARTVRDVRRLIRQQRVSCIFSEPSTPRSVVDAVAGDSGVRRGVLDPAGLDLQPGPDAYFQLMQRLGAALSQCLSGTAPPT